MENMKKYINPQMEIVEIQGSEIVRTSDFEFDVDEWEVEEL